MKLKIESLKFNNAILGTDSDCRVNQTNTIGKEIPEMIIKVFTSLLGPEGKLKFLLFLVSPGFPSSLKSFYLTC